MVSALMGQGAAYLLITPLTKEGIVDKINGEAGGLQMQFGWYVWSCQGGSSHCPLFPTYRSFP